MPIIKNKFFKLAAVPVITAIILVLGFTPAYAGGGEPSINFFSCFTNPFSCAVYGITYLISIIGSLLIALGAWLTSLALKFSESIIESPAVSAGFKISLSIANLGFVAAIIVIAIATILRSQTYGIKKILWKLVVAALLVNFSLVIAGTILTFADGFSKFFIDKASPAGDIPGYINKLTNAFAPQTLLQPPADFRNPPPPSLTPAEKDAWFEAEKQWGNTSSGSFSNFISTILNMVFTIIFTFLIAFTFIALAVMLLIRYVYLGVLLILMPFAWLLWIFPGFESNWSKWWHNFLRWTFFAPIALFFLYLATFTAINKQAEISKIVGAGFNTPDPAGFQDKALAVLTQNPGLLGSTGEKIIVLALALGGLFAANSLGITGAKVAMGLAGKAGNWAGGAAGRFGGRVATRPLRGEGGRKLTEKLQAPGTTKVGRLLRTVTGARYVGRGLEAVGVAGGSKQVDDAERNLRGKTDDQLANNMTTFTAPERMKALEILMRHGTLDKMKDKGGVDRYLNEDQFKRYSQGKLFGDLNKTILSDTTMRDAAKVMDKEGDVNATMVDKKGVLGKAGETVKALDLLTKASLEFAQTLSKSDVSKAQINDVYSGKDAFGVGDEAARHLSESFAMALATARPELVPSMLPKMKGGPLKNFSKLYQDALDFAPISKDETEKRKQAFEKSLLANTMGFVPETPTAGETPSPPPSTPSGPTSKT